MGIISTYLSIVMLFVAFVPAAAFGTPTAQQGGNFSVSDVYIVSSNIDAEVKTMVLKAVNDGGISKPVSGFAITPNNIVTVQQNGKVTVFSTFPLAFSGAKISDISGNIVDVPISTNGEVSFATFPAGVYTLDVIVNDRLAYESIINIGQQPQQLVNQFINTVNQRTYVFVNGTQGNGTSPIGNGTSPIGNGTSPIGNGTSPIGNGTSPTLPGTNATEPTEPTPPGTNATEPTEPTPPGTNATEPTEPTP